MPVELQTIAWQRGNRTQSVVVAGAPWLVTGVATLLAGEFLGYVAPEPDVLLIERAALAPLSDALLLSAKSVILIDPEDRERWRIEALFAGRQNARVVVLPSIAAIGAAEHALLFALTLSRRLLPAYSELVAGTREQSGTPVGNWAGLPEVTPIVGQTLGILGLGRSGQALAARAHGCGLNVIYSDIERKPRAEARLGIAPRRFDQLLREADIISLHLPCTSESVRIIDAPELAAMKPTALLLNVADGRLIDEGALIKTLRQGAILGAGLDTFAYEPLAPDSPLIGFDNVILTPGIAWLSEASERAAWLDQIGQILG